MKTGLLDADHEERMVDAIQFDMVSLFMKMITIATEDAETYCTHHGRKTVHSVDVVKSLRHQARVFIESMTNETLHEAREEMLDCLEEEEEEYSEEEEGEYSEEEEEEEEPHHEEEQRPRDEEMFEDDTKDCDCALCSSIDDSSSTWDAYSPDDTLMQFLKAQVDRVTRIVPEERRHMLGC